MIGRKISNFHINERLGEGGMGTVYKATDTHLGRTVAIKMLHPHMTQQGDAFKRFRNEAQLSARVSHPNVATLYDFQEADGFHFIIMEFVEGKPLDDILRTQKNLPGGEAVKIILQMLEGLTAAHELGILHRDLKPGNIMVNTRGFVKLMDFGIARMENTERLTRQNNVIGTLDYLAPELVKGGDPSPASDLYAIGVMLHEMLAGKPLHEADTEAALMYKIAHEEPNIQLPGVDKRLVQVIKKCVSKQLNRRYQSTQEVEKALLRNYPSGKVNLGLLGDNKLEHKQKQGVIPSSKKEISLSAIHRLLPSLPKEMPKLPQWKGANFSNFRLPYDLDPKIVFPVLFACLFIVIWGNLSSNDSENGEVNEDPIAVLNDSSRVQQANATSYRNGEEGDNTQNLQDLNFTPFQSESNTSKEKRQDPAPKAPTQEKPSQDFQIKPMEKEKKAENNLTESRVERREESPKEVIPQEKETSFFNGPKPVKVTSLNDNSTRAVEEPKEVVKQAVRLRIPERQQLSAQFISRVSTDTHQSGQTVFLSAQNPIYVDGHLVVAQGARIRAQIKISRPAKGTKKALLALQLRQVQAVDGSWLRLEYPEYSNIAKGKVEFQPGTQISNIRLQSSRFTLYGN